MLNIEFLTTDHEGEWPEHENLFVMPFTSRVEAERSASQLRSRTSGDGIIVAIEDLNRQGFVATANQVYMNTRSELFGYIAQDSFGGREWMEHSLRVMTDKKNGLLAFNDGKWCGHLAAFGVARRSWLREVYPGVLFYPGYRSNYADVELTMLALNCDCLCYSPEALLIEVDWTKEGKPTDSQDRRLYRQRAMAGFDGRVSNRELLDRFQ